MIKNVTIKLNIREDKLDTISETLLVALEDVEDTRMPSTKYNPRRMKFDLVDQVIEQEEGRIKTVKQVSHDEDYLRDHFPTFPILPGVMMLEAMVQAASRLCSPEGQRMVLGEVKAVKYGAMVRPGEELQIEVIVHKTNDDGSVSCKGTGTVSRNDTAETETAVAGRFTIRPVRMS